MCPVKMTFVAQLIWKMMQILSSFIAAECPLYFQGYEKFYSGETYLTLFISIIL